MAVLAYYFLAFHYLTKLTLNINEPFNINSSFKWQTLQSLLIPDFNNYVKLFEPTHFGWVVTSSENPVAQKQMNTVHLLNTKKTNISQNWCSNEAIIYHFHVTSESCFPVSLCVVVRTLSVFCLDSPQQHLKQKSLLNCTK